MTGEDLKKHYEKAIACSKPGKTSFETWICGIDSDD
jgi:hypothetical protein